MNGDLEFWEVDMEPGTVLDGVEVWGDLGLSRSADPAGTRDVEESIVIRATEERARALEDVEGVIRVRSWSETEGDGVTESEDGALTMWIVNGGRVDLLDVNHLPRREDFGTEWIAVEAHSATEAFGQARAHDEGGWADFGTAAFAAAYRGGAMSLPGDDLVGTAEIAQRAGVQQATVQAWTERHSSFPEPCRDLAMGRLWWWSDIAAWLAIPRRPGRRPRSA